MIIRSKFKDYYDSACAYGVDPTTVYVRETKEFPNFFEDQRFKSIRYFRDKLKFDIDFIGFCGVIYPVYTWCNYINGKYIFYFRYGEDVFKYEKRYGNENKLNGKWGVKVEKEYVEEISKILVNLFAELDTPIFDTIGTAGRDITINDRLNKYDFARIVPPVEAFQKIHFFLANVLVKDTMKIEPISDLIKRDLHGFDKFSFRKDKQPMKAKIHGKKHHK